MRLLLQGYRILYYQDFEEDTFVRIILGVQLDTFGKPLLQAHCLI